MENACKCERCRELYELPESCDYNINFMKLYVKDAYGNKMLKDIMDICPKCYSELKDWFGRYK